MTAVAAPSAQLTDSELVIARLAAMGRTNEQIAAELVIPIDAVETNLGNAYSKTGTANRAQLCHWLWGEDA
jgi:DNA-binding CsgD family transcriptional regulator